MENSHFYFDYNATTPPSLEARAALTEALEYWGNPSSIHWAGQKAKTLLREARKSIAESLNVHPLELIFTSGGSESNNSVIRGVYQKLIQTNSKRSVYITTKIEHPSVLKTFKELQQKGATVHFLEVDRQGLLDLTTYRSLLSDKVALVSVMMANNETGLLLPVQEMAKWAHEVGALFHTDAVQGYGKIPVDLAGLDVDFASFSAHKVYALKGTGALFVKRGAEWNPLLTGGAQERSRRGGTENTAGIHALGKMAKQIPNLLQDAKRVLALRELMEKRILNEISEVFLTHETASRLPNTSSFVLRGVDGETLLMSLDLKGFAVSTGAACSSGNPEPSPVLLAVGLTREEAQSSLRVSLGAGNDLEQVHRFVDALKEVVTRLRLISGYSANAAAESLNDSRDLGVSHV